MMTFDIQIKVLDKWAYMSNLQFLSNHFCDGYIECEKIKKDREVRIVESRTGKAVESLKHKHGKYKIECLKDGKWESVYDEVVLDFAKGFVCCHCSYYPSNPIRVVDTKTDKVVLEKSGNGKIKLN